MPKRDDIKSILVIGAGPIVIGQACEFDYSGTQACRTLKEEGYKTILVNSNPATVMTDPDICDVTYIEPITKEFVKKVIEKEKPDAILPTMGGQTALNCAMELYHDGTLDKYDIKLIGADIEAIEKAESRDKFRSAMEKIGLSVPKSALAYNMEDAKNIIEDIGLPAIIRPSFTLGGAGGGIAYNIDEYYDIIKAALSASPTNEILIEESVLGWKEFEMEVIRDKKDNCIIICSIENLDPMGIHTGDSITVAPALTLSDKEYQLMRDASFKVLREIGVETGGSNVQFAINPEDGRMIVIEMNPRVSRSSALASKATGFPIAKVATKLAIGYTLDEIQNDITKVTPASFEPSIDYIVTKIPRFTFEKFPDSEQILSTSMKSVGEVMAMGRSFKESLQKALRGLEVGYCGLNEVEFDGMNTKEIDKQKIAATLVQQIPYRILYIAQAFRYGFSVAEVQKLTKIDPWFLQQIYEIVEMENEIKANRLTGEAQKLHDLKAAGFSDERLSQLTGKTIEEVRYRRQTLDVHPSFFRVDTCAAEFDSNTPYLYSAYEGYGVNKHICEAQPSDKKKIAIIGGGPNRIGQGLEFDYCCVHASMALSEIGFETIMINCNPETVSTDFDISDRLYFEPLVAEDVIEVLRIEASRGELVGVIVQFGGQTPLKLAADIEKAGFKILGTELSSIDLSEDRELFQQHVQSLGLKQPENAIATSATEALTKAREIGFPIVMRPSYVLGGRAMEIVYNEEQLLKYMQKVTKVAQGKPILLDSFLQAAVEIDVDAICDEGDVYVAAIMEHIEEAGIHSGDSACVLPAPFLSEKAKQEIDRQTRLLGKSLNVKGLMNIQFALKDEEVFLIEVNPRASRTVPFAAKATNVPIAKIAAKVMAGEKLTSFALGDRCKDLPYSAVKEAVIPFARFKGVDPMLGPEMRSTGEVMGIADSFADAFYRSQLAASMQLPGSGNAFVSVKDEDKAQVVDICKDLQKLGFKLIATKGTAEYLQKHDISSTVVNKVTQGRPHCVDMLISNQMHIVVNTGSGKQSVKDGESMRRLCVLKQIPYYTTISGAKAAIAAIDFNNNNTSFVNSLQDMQKLL